MSRPKSETSLNWPCMVRLTDADRLPVAAAANAAGVNVSEWIRALIRSAIAKGES